MANYQFVCLCSIQSLKDVAADLVYEDGNILSDYAQKQGMINTSLTSAKVTHVLLIFHAKL